MVRLRRTMMFIPGNNPSMITDGHIYGSDSIMFDLEDAVSINEKDVARFLVYNALKSMDYGTTETVVRVNGLDTPFGKDDYEAMVRAKVDVIRLPKTDKAEEVIEADQLITKIEEEIGLEVGAIKLMAAIESPLGILNAYDIATASERLIAIALGAEDFVTNMKTNRSDSGVELLAARGQLLLAARAAGIYALDTVYSDIDNLKGFTEEAKLIKQMGFDGKSVIHPSQINIVHKLYEPTEKEIDHAIRVLHGIKEAESKGSGVITVDGSMVDGPIVDRAHRVIELAKATGVFEEGDLVE